MSIYEILPALDLTQSVHAKISIGMHRVVKFKISRIPLIGLETRLGWRTDRKFLQNPNLNEISFSPLAIFITDLPNLAHNVCIEFPVLCVLQYYYQYCWMKNTGASSIVCFTILVLPVLLDEEYWSFRYCV
jgi:hypothetical protein